VGCALRKIFPKIFLNFQLKNFSRGSTLASLSALAEEICFRYWKLELLFISRESGITYSSEKFPICRPQAGGAREQNKKLFDYLTSIK